MRRTLSAVLLAALLSGALVALPTLTSATAAPRPVPPTVEQIPLRGIDAAAAGRLAPDAEEQAAGARHEAADGHGHEDGELVLLSAPRPTGRFSLVGVTWAPDPAVGEPTVEVRHRSAGRWSPWQALESSADHAPDAGSADAAGGLRAGTDPLWTGPSDGVQARVEVVDGAVPQDVQIELVDPGTSPADALPELPRATAHAGESRPEIVTRAQWGADESLRRGSPSYNATVRVGFVHHTASSNDYSPQQAAAMVRGIYAYHVKSNGWSDLGYNYLVDRFGRAYEGRAGGLDRFVLGSHTGGFNRDTFAVSLLGDFSTVPPSDQTVGTLSRVLAWKLGQAHRDPAGRATLTSAGGGTSRYAAGVRAAFDVVSGHRDAGNTSCPGATTYARMGQIRRQVQHDLGAAFVEPRLSATRVPLGSRVPVALTARTLGDVAWTATAVDRTGAVVRSWSGRAADAAVQVEWDLLDAAGAPLRPGSYGLRLTGAAGDDAAEAVTASLTVGGRSCAGLPYARSVCRAQQSRVDRGTAPAVPPGEPVGEGDGAPVAAPTAP